NVNRWLNLKLSGLHVNYVFRAGPSSWIHLQGKVFTKPNNRSASTGAPGSILSRQACASAVTPRASNTTATRIDDTAALFIERLVSSVIYHADRDKGKCDLHGGRRQGFVIRSQGHHEIELYATDRRGRI